MPFPNNCPQLQDLRSSSTRAASAAGWSTGCTSSAIPG